MSESGLQVYRIYGMDVDEEIQPCKSGMFMFLSESRIVADDTDCADFVLWKPPKPPLSGGL